MFERRSLSMFMIVLLLAGCQHSKPQGLGLFADSNARSPKLSKAQTADVQIALGRSLEKRGDIAGAVETYQEALKRDPQRVDAYLRLAILHDQQGKFKESAGYYNEALKADAGSAEIYSNAGYSCYLQHRYEDAERFLRRALELKPDDPLAHNNLALVLARTERFDEAFAEFRKGGCDDSQAHSNLGFVLAMNQCWVEAKNQYARALAINPSMQAARHDLKAVNDLLAKYPSASRDGASTVQLTNFEQHAN